MFPIAKEEGLTVSISETRGRGLIGDREATRLDGPKNALVYEVDGVDVKFYPGGYTTVNGEEEKVLSLVG